ncbi:MAG: hypothetical protein F6K10_08215 [Moorea sp. SIO2B7]|nr:hypothetical protein [Moorena sp. SIO2B7]
MLKRTSFSLAIFLIILTLAPQSNAATLKGNTVEKQIKELTKWFSGKFSNSPQVEQEPDVPLINMSNCPVQITGGNFEPNVKSIFLEQKFLTIPQSPRLRYYAFSPGIEGIKLSIQSFDDPTNLSGLCNLPFSQRAINFSNIKTESCELELFRLLEPVRYFGTNSPQGCPAASNPFLTVISDISITNNQIDSLDRGFIGNIQVFGTPITFTRKTVPESSLVTGLLTLFMMGIGLNLRNKEKL